MPDRDTFDAPFERPRALFLPFAPRLVVEADTPLRYTLNAPPSATYPAASSLVRCRARSTT